MPVFISHSFENQPEFESVAHTLKQDGVSYWDPEVPAGASLRDQLRQAVNQCEACIFIATKQSVNSSWCGSELGAFWGAGKPIFVFLAEASLPPSELPSIVQGDVWERRPFRISALVKDIASAADRIEPSAQGRRSSTVGQLTIDQLEKVIIGAVSLAAAAAKGDAMQQSFQTVESAAKGVAGRVLAGFQAAESLGASHRTSGNKILWVDDRPQNNVYERQTMAAMGFEFVRKREAVAHG